MATTSTDVSTDSTQWIQSVEAFIKKSGSNHLDLENREVKIDSVKVVLKSLPTSHIKQLSLEGTDISDGMAQLTEILTKSKVSQLNISSCNLTNQDFMNFMKILGKTQVTKLNASKNYFQFEENEVRELASYLHKSQLTELGLNNVNFPPEIGGLPLIQDLPNTLITHLDLSRATLTHDALVVLFTNLPITTITNLNVSDNQITQNEMEALKLGLKSSNLKVLDLSNNSIDDAGINILLSGLVFSKIIDLNLSSNDFHETNSLMEHLKATPIKALNLGKNQLEGRDIFYSRDLWENSSLKTFDVGGCNLPEEASFNLMHSLKKSKITKLIVRENNLQPASIIEFANSVKHTKITEVDFSDNDLQGEGFITLGNCLKNSKIKSIDVSNNFKHPVGDEALAEFITKTKGSAVQSLKMNYNELLSYGAQTIASSLANTTFTYFDLSSNWIEDGVTAIAENLKLTLITVLDLSNNKIEDEGAEVLAKCLENTQVISLNINTNAITNRGAKALAAAISAKKSNLLELKIEENDIENEGLDSLAESIKSSYITVLDVKNNPGDRTLHIDSVLWKNRKAAQQLISVFKRITSETSDGSISFPQNITSTNADGFLNDCLWFSRTITHHKSAVNVLIQDRSITFSSSQIVTFMTDEFPTEFAKFVGSKIEADVAQYVNLLRKAEEMGLKKIVSHLLLNRPNYVIDQDQNILHPYVYKLLFKYNLPLCNEAIEPGRKEQLIQYFSQHSDLPGARSVIDILNRLP